MCKKKQNLEENNFPKIRAVIEFDEIVEIPKCFFVKRKFGDDWKGLSFDGEIIAIIKRKTKGIEDDN